MGIKCGASKRRIRRKSGSVGMWDRQWDGRDERRPLAASVEVPTVAGLTAKNKRIGIDWDLGKAVKGKQLLGNVCHACLSIESLRR